jgi:putative Mn2+ efflux pump MntP
LLSRWISHIDGDVVIFGTLAVVAFWFAIQLGFSVRGRRWQSVAARLAGAVVLVGFGVVMIFFTAFGTN